MALMEEVSLLRVDFEVLKDSGCFYLVLSLLVCGLRCEPPLPVAIVDSNSLAV